MVRYSNELIDDIRSSNDIVDIISQYVTLKRSGRSFFGLCPFHNEKSPSFSVSPDKQIFHCFGCGAGGNVIHFTQKIENLTFREALESLAERANIALPTSSDPEDTAKQYLKDRMYKINELTAQFYHENLYKPTSKQAQDYIKQRKLDNRTLKAFKIGYSGNFNELYMFLKSQGFKDDEILATGLVNKNDRGQFVDRYRKRLMFPILDVRDKVIAFGGRILEKDAKTAKYINSNENLVYSKGRNLFAMNLAKKSAQKRIIVVEGYMDAISLYQRGFDNVVASLGTALTEAQGRLLRKYGEQVILSYDSDGAGQAAIVRGMDILKKLGCDVRILQMEGAKDPDEYVIKYGSGRFNLLVDNAISLVEYKVKILKDKYNLDNTNDKIKFLNEISKVLSEVDNKIEKEIFIEKIARTYSISAEAIYAEVNKLNYNKVSQEKVLEKKVPVVKVKTENINEAVLKREKMIIYLLVINSSEALEKLRKSINFEDFKSEINKKIVNKILELYAAGIHDATQVLNSFEEPEEISHVTEIMADDYEISSVDKCIEDIIYSYNKDKLISEKNEILSIIENSDLTKEEIANLETRLSQIIIELAKMK